MSRGHATHIHMLLVLFFVMACMSPALLVSIVLLVIPPLPRPSELLLLHRDAFQDLGLIDNPIPPSSSSFSAPYSAATLPPLTANFDSPPANFDKLIETEVKNFPTYHADFSHTDTSSTMMLDPTGRLINMPFSGKTTAFTYYTPGKLTYSPQTFVPNYTESVFLSVASNPTSTNQTPFDGFDFADEVWLEPYSNG